MYYKYLFKLLLLVKRIKRWIIGHDERMGQPENYEDPYCARCDMSWPPDTNTLPGIREEIYWWFIELFDEYHFITHATDQSRPDPNSKIVDDAK